MSIALFGGSFDPVHLGHINAVRSLIADTEGLERVIIMPARINPFKVKNAPCASAEDRLNMCRLAFLHEPLCSVCDFEIKRDGPSYTAKTLEYLSEKFPQKRLILFLGSDSLFSLPDWKNAHSIFRLADIAAAARSDGDAAMISAAAENVKKAGGRVRIIKTLPFEISSTEIREKLLKNEDISCYMDQNVVKYITERKIYLQRRCCDA